jgi:hypothetical protein
MKGALMKHILLIIVLLAFACTQFAVTITTATGENIKGDITKKVNDRYHLNTYLGERVVFQAEIVKVMSDAGFDVTQSILDMPSVSETTNLIESGNIKQAPDMSKMTEREYQMFLSQQQIEASNRTTSAVWMTWGLSIAIGVIGGLAVIASTK